MHQEALKRNPRHAARKDAMESATDEERRKMWADKQRESLQVRIDFGQRTRAFINLNGMLKKLIAVADPDALRLARRFHMVGRESIYIGAVLSPRAAQLIDVFPVLGLEIYCPPNEETWDRSRAAAKMVEAGRKLNRIAGFMEIPMWARKIKPAVAHLYGYVPEDLARYIPDATRDQQRWIRAFAYRQPRLWMQDKALGKWVARHVLEFGGGPYPTERVVRHWRLDRGKPA
jgi:hypothetical protein